MTGFPSPLDDDPEDVTWGLTTGAALWKRGERYDAIVWLKRAVEAALEAGRGGRADELNHAATDLIAALAARAAQGRSASDSSGSMKAAPRRPPPPPAAALRAAAPPGLPPLGSRPPPPPSPPPASLQRAGGRPLPPPRPPPPRPGGSSPASRAHVPPQRSPAPPPPVLLAKPSGELLPLPAASETLPEPRFGFEEEPPTVERGLTPELLDSAIGSGAPPRVPPSSDSRMAAATQALLDALAAEPSPDEVAPERSEEAAREPAAEEPLESADELLAATDALLGASAQRDEPATPVAPAVTEPLTPVAPPAEPPTPVAPPAEHAAPELPFSLEGVRALEALNEDQRIEVIRLARVDTLALDEEIKVAGLVLVLEGEAAIQSAIADVPAARLKAGDVLYARGSIPETLPLRLSATTDPTRVAAWEQRAIEEVLGRVPGLVEALQHASDRTQALAGSTIGPIGERLDENLRALAIERLQIRVLQPEEVLAEGGLPVPGLVIVGVGSVQVEVGGELRERLGPGDFLFATEVLGGGKAPGTARAGAKGATVLFGKRGLAQELLVTCPPLLEIFAGM